MDYSASFGERIIRLKDLAMVPPLIDQGTRQQYREAPPTPPSTVTEQILSSFYVKKKEPEKDRKPIGSCCRFDSELETNNLINILENGKEKEVDAALETLAWNISTHLNENISGDLISQMEWRLIDGKLTAGGVSMMDLTKHMADSYQKDVATINDTLALDPTVSFGVLVSPDYLDTQKDVHAVYILERDKTDPSKIIATELKVHGDEKVLEQFVGNLKEKIGSTYSASTNHGAFVGSSDETISFSTILSVVKDTYNGKLLDNPAVKKYFARAVYDLSNAKIVLERQKERYQIIQKQVNSLKNILKEGLDNGNLRERVKVLAEMGPQLAIALYENELRGTVFNHYTRPDKTATEKSRPTTTQANYANSSEIDYERKAYDRTNSRGLVVTGLAALAKWHKISDDRTMAKSASKAPPASRRIPRDEPVTSQTRLKGYRPLLRLKNLMGFYASPQTADPRSTSEKKYNFKPHTKNINKATKNSLPTSDFDNDKKPDNASTFLDKAFNRGRAALVNLKGFISIAKQPGSRLRSGNTSDLIANLPGLKQHTKGASQDSHVTNDRKVETTSLSQTDHRSHNEHLSSELIQPSDTVSNKGSDTMAMSQSELLEQKNSLLNQGNGDNNTLSSNSHYLTNSTVVSEQLDQTPLATLSAMTEQSEALKQLRIEPNSFDFGITLEMQEALKDLAANDFFNLSDQELYVEVVKLLHLDIPEDFNLAMALEVFSIQMPEATPNISIQTTATVIQEELLSARRQNQAKSQNEKTTEQDTLTNADQKPQIYNQTKSIEHEQVQILQIQPTSQGPLQEKQLQLRVIASASSSIENHDLKTSLHLQPKGGATIHSDQRVAVSAKALHLRNKKKIANKTKDRIKNKKSIGKATAKKVSQLKDIKHANNEGEKILLNDNSHEENNKVRVISLTEQARDIIKSLLDNHKKIIGIDKLSPKNHLSTRIRRLRTSVALSLAEEALQRNIDLNTILKKRKKRHSHFDLEELIIELLNLLGITSSERQVILNALKLEQLVDQDIDQITTTLHAYTDKSDEIYDQEMRINPI